MSFEGKGPNGWERTAPRLVVKALGLGGLAVTLLPAGCFLSTAGDTAGGSGGSGGTSGSSSSHTASSSSHAATSTSGSTSGPGSTSGSGGSGGSSSSSSSSSSNVSSSSAGTGGATSSSSSNSSSATGTTMPQSCDDIFNANPSSADSIYMIQPAGSAAPFEAFCSFVSGPQPAGGGWTAVLRAGSSPTMLGYDSTYWTTDDLFGSVSPGETEAKMMAFNTVVAHVGVRIFITAGGQTNGMIAPFTSGTSGTFKDLLANHAKTNAGSTAWAGLIAGSRLQTSTCGEGFNVGTSPNLRVRFGLLADDSNCGIPDSFIGVGSSDGGVATGNACNYSSAGCATTGDIPGFAYVSVR